MYDLGKDSFERKKINFFAPLVNVKIIDHLAKLSGLDRTSYLNKLMFDDIQKAYGNGMLDNLE